MKLFKRSVNSLLGQTNKFVLQGDLNGLENTGRQSSGVNRCYGSSYLALLFFYETGKHLFPPPTLRPKVPPLAVYEHSARSHSLLLP